MKKKTHTITPDKLLIPAREAWLFKNTQAAMSILRGIEQSKSGKTKNLGSFIHFAELDEDG